MLFGLFCFVAINPRKHFVVLDFHIWTLTNVAAASVATAEESLDGGQCRCCLAFSPGSERRPSTASECPASMLSGPYFSGSFGALRGITKKGSGFEAPATQPKKVNQHIHNNGWRAAAEAMSSGEPAGRTRWSEESDTLCRINLQPTTLSDVGRIRTSG